MDNDVKRKCGFCGKYLYINENTINEAVYYDKKTYHKDCFINICKERIKGKKESSPTYKKWKKALDDLPYILISTKDKYSKDIYKQKIFNFICENYNMTVVPSSIFQKLADIYSGSYRGMAKGIPPEHIYDMWKRKMSFLNRIAYKNELSGKHMNNAQRVSYDLSVLINKYDDYLKWIEKQKIIELKDDSKNQDKLITSNVSILSANKNCKDDEENNDISNLVDDIFG